MEFVHNVLIKCLIKAFEHCVEEKACSKRDCLYFLEQFTSGQSRELVQSCQHLDPEVGYSLAKKLLKEQFGNEFKIAAAYMEKVLSWPSLKNEDAQGLHAYSLFLRACCNIIADNSYMQELNMPNNMRTVVMKLPFKLRERWREKACEIIELNQGRAKFSDIVDFIERQAKMASDPVFGCIQDKQPSSVKPNKTFKGNSFATNVTTSGSRRHVTSQQRDHSVYETNNKRSCLFCSGNHVLERCDAFDKRSQREKLDFLKGKGVCFSCLKTGHVSKECDNRLVCEVCSQTHPSVLHLHRKPVVEDKEQKRSLASAQTCGHTGAGNEKCLLSIIPVQVKSAKGDKLIQTYAFLDPGERWRSYLWKEPWVFGGVQKLMFFNLECSSNPNNVHEEEFCLQSVLCMILWDLLLLLCYLPSYFYRNCVSRIWVGMRIYPQYFKHGGIVGFLIWIRW